MAKMAGQSVRRKVTAGREHYYAGEGKLLAAWIGTNSMDTKLQDVSCLSP